MRNCSPSGWSVAGMCGSRLTEGTLACYDQKSKVITKDLFFKRREKRRTLQTSLFERRESVKTRTRLVSGSDSEGKVAHYRSRTLQHSVFRFSRTLTTFNHVHRCD